MVFQKNTTPELVKVLCSNFFLEKARAFYSREKFSVSKNCQPFVCLLMLGRFSCLVTKFCWAVNNFYCN